MNYKTGTAVRTNILSHWNKTVDNDISVTMKSKSLKSETYQNALYIPIAQARGFTAHFGNPIKFISDYHGLHCLHNNHQSKLE
jgi:hypothetical protein